MSNTFRLKDTEQRALRKKTIEFNKQLVRREMVPLKDSEVLHAILAEAIDKAAISDAGTIRLHNAGIAPP